MVFESSTCWCGATFIRHQKPSEHCASYRNPRAERRNLTPTARAERRNPTLTARAANTVVVGLLPCRRRQLPQPRRSSSSVTPRRQRRPMSMVPPLPPTTAPSRNNSSTPRSAPRRTPVPRRRRRRSTASPVPLPLVIRRLATRIARSARRGAHGRTMTDTRWSTSVLGKVCMCRFSLAIQEYSTRQSIFYSTSFLLFFVAV